jgi:hypothetical protein
MLLFSHHHLELLTLRRLPGTSFWTVVCALTTLLSLHIAVDTAAAATAPPMTTAPIASPFKAPEKWSWRELQPHQQASLKPLEREWELMELENKKKWLELSQRFPKMSAPEQARVQTRMVEWAKLSPKERGQARLNYQEALLIPAPHRQARWETYQALPAEQRLELLGRSAPASSAFNSKSRQFATVPTQSSTKIERQSQPLLFEAPQVKSNIVPNPKSSAPPEFVAPVVVRANPGATTTLISKRPAPPAHQQTGQPKIAATPEFVDKATLLPKQGPQATATRSTAGPQSSASNVVGARQ